MQIRAARLLLSLLPVAAFACGTVAAVERPGSPIPLEKGTRWVYEARVRWTPVSGSGQTGVQSNRLEWTSEVVDCIRGKSTRAAVVHAFPMDILGMDPVKPTGYTVLVETGNKLYSAPAKTARQASKLAKRFAANPERLAGQNELLLDLPLHADKRWGGDAETAARTDGWYCWRVETEKAQTLQVKGLPSADYHIIYTVAYRTNPDHQVLDIAPGVGLTHLEYEHHGAVFSEDVRLVELKRPILSPTTPPTPAR